MSIEVVSKKQANLARLLAQENITIEFANVSTASFNIKTRLLTFPIMKENLSQELYDLFTGHEIGHAIFTPDDYTNDSITIPDALKTSNKKGDKVLEQNLKNIVEDIRIEKLIKRKYPGLRRDFRVGYEQLFQQNFFKTDGKDINSLGFLNKLNLNAKIGEAAGVIFTPEEQKLVDKCESMVSFDDTLKACQEIIDYVATKKDTLINDDEGSGEFEIDDDGDAGDGDGIPFHNQAPPDDELLDRPDKDDNEETDTDKPPQGASHQVSYKENRSEKKEVQDDLDASTNDELMKSVQNLLNKKTNVLNLHVPKFNLANIIVSNETFMTALNGVVLSEKLTQFEVNKRYFDYRKNNISVIKYLVKEFELKKRAQELQREQVYKTGQLDMKRVSKYQLTPDIFRRSVFTPGGKSHGLQIFIDWSSSMDDCLYNCMIQLFCITDFCRAVNIPFDVYSFRSSVKPGLTDLHNNVENFQTKLPGHMDLHNFHLVHLLTNKQSFTQYVQTQKQMLTIWKQNADLSRCYMDTIATPLNNCIVAAMDIIPNFKQAYNLQIVNSIFITDGASDDTGIYFDPHDTDKKLVSGRGNNIYIHDPITKNHEKVIPYTYTGAGSCGGHYMTQELLQLLQKRTEANVIGFYLTDMSYQHINGHFTHPNNKQTERLWSENGYAIQFGVGYTVHYCINIKNLKIKTDSLDSIVGSKKPTQKVIDDAWAIQLTNRLNNRAMLTNFIQHIA